MTLTEIEALVQKAIGIDCFAPNKIIVLLYNTQREGIDAYLALINNFPWSHPMTLHVDYKDFANVAFVSKETADTIAVKNLKYHNGKSTYVQLMGMVDIAQPDENILFQAAWVRPDGKYDIAYKPERTEGYDPLNPELLNITGISAKFIE